MNKSLLVFFLCFPVLCMGQRGQRLKGRVVDMESKAPLTGVAVGIADLTEALGAATDINGDFVIENVPVGKHTVSMTYMGYQGITLENVLVTSGKEAVLNMEMQESAVEMKEVVVAVKREHINDMATASTRTFDVQQTERYAGSRSDPARMASNFAGAQGGDDSRNDIVIRGNSPQGVLWRMEGVDIPSPNHFSVPGTTGGPASILNNKTLANCDFFMGAFPAEYGDAIAGVFDLKLRNGNKDRYEFTGQLGFLGTELAAEGPISRKHGSSFLITYRYSTLQLFQGLNIKIGTSSVPKYQDGAFKFNFPMGKKGDLAFWGLGGLSNIDLIVSNLTTKPSELYGESDRDQYFKSNTGIVGATYNYTIDKNTYTKLTIAETGTDIWANHVKVFRNPDYSVSALKDILGYDFKTGATVAHWFLNKKLSAKQTLKFGLVNNLYNLNLTDSSRQYPVSRQDWVTREKYKGSTDLLQAYVQYKYRFNDKLTLTGGVHGQYLTLNGSQSVEPRIGMRWAVNDVNTITAGVGLHSQMQQLYQYYAVDTNGVMVNKNVGFTRSQHMVAGYDHAFSKTVHTHVEAYGQYLFNVPVETRVGSSYSAIDQGSTFSRDFPGTLKNTGTGYNYGLELTLEKTFSQGYYVLLTGSVFDSKAAGNDGVYRNTDFNTHYAANILGGYEHKLGHYSTLITGAKATFIGGKLYSPVNVDASTKLGDMVIVDNQRNTLAFPAYFRADLKLGVRLNSKKVTHEIALDLVNITGQKNVLSLTYNSDLGMQGSSYPFNTQYQLGFLPLFYYRIDFGAKHNNP